jgi:ribonuclease BN (tRNA processing enzyme)
MPMRQVRRRSRSGPVRGSRSAPPACPASPEGNRIWIMQLQFVGCGDAFGSGGRFNTCFHLTGARTNCLIDCGATSLVALKRLGIERNAIDLILITHFHADHFGGVPFFVLDAQFFSKRSQPLTIAGPIGLKQAYANVMETAFAGSSRASRKFELSLVELAPDKLWHAHNIDVLPTRVRHGEVDGPFHAYRIIAEKRVIAYTGDTEWTDALIGIGRDADLLIAESYSFEKKVPLHLSYRSLLEQLAAINPKRLILTHMNDDMLGRTIEVTHERATDGLIVAV